VKPKSLFVVTAVTEVGIGLALMVSPALPVLILIGAPFDTPADLVVGRVAGAALLALGLACCRARAEEHSRAATGIVSAILLYNVAVAGVLAYAGIGLRLFGVGLWPTVVLHVVMAVWCVACLLAKRS
jgi:hypothetical protein